MGRGDGSALLYGPPARRSHQFDACAPVTLAEVEATYEEELQRFLPLLTEWSIPGSTEKMLVGLCTDLKGRTVIVPAGTKVQRVMDPNPMRYAAETLSEHALLEVVAATPGKRVRGGRPWLAHIHADDVDHRYKVDLRHVAVIFPRSAIPKLPGPPID